MKKYENLKNYKKRQCLKNYKKYLKKNRKNCKSKKL